MPKDLLQIHQLLTSQFPGEIAEFVQPTVGDPSIRVLDPSAIHRVCEYLRNNKELAFNYLRVISTLDWKDKLSVVYHLYSYTHQHPLDLMVDLPRENPSVPSVCDLWPAANWHEREAFDMMGVCFENHPDHRRILLPDDWEGYPLRKDYQAPADYNGITNT
jgi:NADH-quinone oxidoreductase subunit C